MTPPVYKLHEHIRPIGKMFKCWCLNFVAVNSKQKLKIDLGDGNTANVQADNATWIVTPSQGNTGQEQNNTNIRTDPVGFFQLVFLQNLVSPLQRSLLRLKL